MSRCGWGTIPRASPRCSRPPPAARLPESRADYLSAIWRGRPFCVISETMGKEAARAGNYVPRRHVLEGLAATGARSEEHTSELQSLMRTSYAVLCLKKKTT